jgi:tetratricopeptide (TPR) repeat protein
MLFLTPRASTAQLADPKAVFVEHLGRFSMALDRPSLDALTRSLAEWDAAVRSSEAQFASSLPGSSTPVAARLHVALGAAYLNRRRVQDALREFEAGSHLDPARADVFTFLGVARDQLLGDFDRAAAAYRQAASLDPLNATRAYLLARALDKAGRHAEAIEAYQAVLRLWRRDIGEHTAMAIDAPFIQLALVEERPGVEPFFPPLQYAEGFELLRRGEYAKAIESFNWAADSAETSREEAPGAAHYRLARLYQLENKTLEALAEYEAAEKLKPFVGRGRLLQAIGALQAAQQNFDAALQADSARVDVNLNNAGAHRTLGYLYSRLERHDEAFAEFAIALTIAPNSPDIYVAMSQMHLKRADYAAAADAAARAIRLSPSNKQAHYSLATALVRLGRGEDAKPEFEAFERLQAEDTAAASRQMTINGFRRQAAASLERKEYAVAVAALRKALELAPEDVELRDDLADAEALQHRAER